MDPARRRLTYADLLAADDPFRPEPELIDGEITYKASPRGTHGFTHGQIARAIGPMYDDPHDGWWILIDPDCLFADDRVLRPDLAGWRKSRLAYVEATPIAIRPDWVCEILSPGHESYDRQTKRAIYAQEGVPHLWLVHPEERNVEAFALHDGQWLLLNTWTRGEARIPPFENLPIVVDRLFAPRRDDPPLVHEP